MALAGRLIPVFLLLLAAGVPARAQTADPLQPGVPGAPPAPAELPPPPPPVESSGASSLPRGPGLGGTVRYLVEQIEVRGNRKTSAALVLRELGIVPGDVLTPGDWRVQAAELRLLSLAYFRRVSLRVLPRDRRRATVTLVVEVVERGTIILNALYLGSSEATLLWGGLDVSEMNAFGQGIMLGGGMVASTTPTVPEARAGRGLTLRAAGPPRRGGLALAGSLLYSQGSEFFQTSGRDDEVDPSRWRALEIRRLGGTLSVGGELSRTARFSTEGRFESVRATLPDIRTRDLFGDQARPVDFRIHEGQSRLASLAGTLDLDTRSDPVLPSQGRRLALSVEVSLPAIGSSYSYAKGIAQGSFYIPAFRDHVLGLHTLAGAILGDAPYFNQFFVGDLNFLLPSRALGLNFSTLPSRNFLGTNVAGRRYEPFAARLLAEYAIPLWRGGGVVYRGDAFAAFGVFALASLDDLRMRDQELGPSIPVDLTADLGLRLDTYIGIFTISIGNGLGRLPL